MHGPRNKALIQIRPLRSGCRAAPVAARRQHRQLAPKASELLLVLVQSGGGCFPKRICCGKVWPDSFVEEANLSHNIYKLREALGDGVDGQEYIDRTKTFACPGTSRASMPVWAIKTGRSPCWSAPAGGAIRGCGISNWTSGSKICIPTRDSGTFCGAWECRNSSGDNRRATANPEYRP